MSVKGGEIQLLTVARQRLFAQAERQGVDPGVEQGGFEPLGRRGQVGIIGVRIGIDYPGQRQWFYFHIYLCIY